jgi:hypothetical protein
MATSSAGVSSRPGARLAGLQQLLAELSLELGRGVERVDPASSSSERTPNSRRNSSLVL